METIIKIIALPFIPLVFAYLELGGNWFGLRLLQRGPSIWSIAGTVVFSVLYSLVSAFVAVKLKLDIGLLMVAYGFGFSIVAIFLQLEWGKLPSFSKELITKNPLLFLVAGIALVGFIISSYLVISRPSQNT
jgi:hypothetical protein